MLTHTGSKTLKTKRLTIRPYKLTDSDDVYNSWASDENVARYMTFTPHSSLEQTKETIEKWVALYDRPSIYLWAIEMNGKVIGNINVVSISNTLESCEIGYCLGKKYWGQGIMTETAQAVIDYMFESVGVHRVEIQHVKENPASGKIAQKCGMTFEGTKREAFKGVDGKFYDLDCYGITRDEWNARKNQSK